jgi:hypothetical protein
VSTTAAARPLAVDQTAGPDCSKVCTHEQLEQSSSELRLAVGVIHTLSTACRERGGRTRGVRRSLGCASRERRQNRPPGEGSAGESVVGAVGAGLNCSAPQIPPLKELDHVVAIDATIMVEIRVAIPGVPMAEESDQVVAVDSARAVDAGVADHDLADVARRRAARAPEDVPICSASGSFPSPSLGRKAVDTFRPLPAEADRTGLGLKGDNSCAGRSTRRNRAVPAATCTKLKRSGE